MVEWVEVDFWLEWVGGLVEKEATPEYPRNFFNGKRRCFCNGVAEDEDIERKQRACV